MGERCEGSSPDAARGKEKEEVIDEQSDESDSEEIIDEQSDESDSEEIIDEQSDVSDSEWIKKMQGKMREFRLLLDSPESKTGSIFMVPQGLRGERPENYEPKVVSIGPYHRDKSELPIQDKHKWSCVYRLALRSDKADLQILMSYIMPIENEARSYYPDRVPTMGRQRFLEMLLLDCCFILQVVLIIAYEQHSPLPLDQIIVDFLLLENQIPFFVLDMLNRHAVGVYINRVLFNRSSLGMICTMGILGARAHILEEKDEENMWPLRYTEKVQHLLHLFYLSLYPADVESSAIDVESRAPAALRSTAPRHFPSATELQDRYAVKFKKGIADNFMGIRFHNGVMEIPFLQISNDSSRLLCNLIAFEQCYRPIEPCVATYAAFMDCLLNKESDADLLESNGILLNRLPTSRDAAFFFSKMSPSSEFPSSSKYLDDVLEGINIYQKNKWNRWKAELKLNYFSNPWVSLSVVAAAVLLILGFIQALYSVLGYQHS